MAQGLPYDSHSFSLVRVYGLETYKKKITLLGEENKALQASLKHSQAEIEDLQAIVDDVNFKQGAANTSSERIESKLTVIEEIIDSLE